MVGETIRPMCYIDVAVWFPLVDAWVWNRVVVHVVHFPIAFALDPRMTCGTHIYHTYANGLLLLGDGARKDAAGV
jgi:hypothetical protein